MIGKLRERLAPRQHGGVREAAIISTCNRTELVCAVETPEHARGALAAFVAAEKHLDQSELAHSTYVLPQSTPCVTRSASPAAWTRWFSGSRRSSAR